LAGRQEGHLACKTEWWGVGMVICLGHGADLHMAQLMPLLLLQKNPDWFWQQLTWVIQDKVQRAIKWLCM